MSLDLSKFKKIKEDKHSAVLEHPAGHKITIAKNALSQDVKKQLSQIPLYQAEPEDMIPDPNEESMAPAQSEAPTYLEDASPQPQAQAPAPQIQPQVQTTNPSGHTTNIFVGTQPPAAAQSAVEDPKTNLGAKEEAQNVIDKAPQNFPEPKKLESPGSVSSRVPNMGAAAPADPALNQMNPLDMPQQAFQMKLQGINQQAQDEAAQSRQEAGIYGQQAGAMTDVARGRLQEVDAWWKKRKYLEDQLAGGHIDGMRVINNMSTGKKILTGLGMFLSGLSGPVGAMARQGMGFLNKQIDADVQDQKQSIHNTETLLGAHLQDYGNIKDAEAATKVDLNDIVAAHLRQVAARSNDPIIRDKALQLSSEVYNQGSNILQKNVFDKWAFKQMQGQIPAMGGGASQGQAPQGQPSKAVDPANFVNLMQKMGQVDPKSFDQGLKEASVLTARQKALAAVDENIRQQVQLQGVGSRLMNPIQSNSKLDTLHAGMVPMILDAAPSKRLTPESVKQEIDPFNIGLTDDAKTAQFKAQKLKQYIIQQSDDTPLLRSMEQMYGVNFGTTKPPSGNGSSLKSKEGPPK